MKKTVKACIAIVPSEGNRLFNPCGGLSVVLSKSEACYEEKRVCGYIKHIPCTITYEIPKRKRSR